MLICNKTTLVSTLQSEFKLYSMLTLTILKFCHSLETCIKLVLTMSCNYIQMKNNVDDNYVCFCYLTNTLIKKVKDYKTLQTTFKLRYLTTIQNDIYRIS